MVVVTEMKKTTERTRGGREKRGGEEGGKVSE